MKDKIILIGIGLGILFWIFESAMHVFVFHQGNIFSQLFTPDLHELWMRSTVICILILLSFYARFLIEKRKRAEEMIKLERDNISNIINSMEDGVYIGRRNFEIRKKQNAGSYRWLI